MFRLSNCLYILTLAFTMQAAAQPTYERHRAEVNQYLSRMAQKGLIVWDDNIQPLRMDLITVALDSLQARASKLSSIEKKELSFYQNFYQSASGKYQLGYKTEDFSLKLFPIISGQLHSSDSFSYFKKSIGVNLYGSISKRWGYQLSFQDITENGSLLDTSKQSIEAALETGYVKNSLFNNKSINYTEIRAHLSYAFTKGMVSVGQDYLTWGYGQGGKLVLSDKAPTYPFLRLDLQLLPWLRFNYAHAWLKSDIPDSSRSYTIPNPISGGIREVMVQKFLALHSLDIRLMKGLNLMLGESMLYTDKLNLGYFIPVMFFKAFDNYSGNNSITRGSNGQFFAQLSSRDQLSNTHLYGTLFIDEIKISKVFNSTERRNHLGYTIGANITDLGLAYLTLGAEYTRIRPFVYRNFLPAQNYTSAGFALGDWMGANADRFLLFANYTPLPRLKLQLKYQFLRKGDEGTLEQQYLQQPQPKFLFGQRRQWSDFLFKATYEAIPRLNTQLFLRSLNGALHFNAGLSYGL
ncbi:MAG: capsule assembly Wzi family protein [Bacteroidetes bacterium]|nr:capsule assembly Wzi family protein [Bacteroidota bacterium]